MDPEEFRKYAHQAVDWMADLLAHPERHPVVPNTTPGELVDALPAAAPEHGEPMDVIFRDFEDLVVPRVTMWNHPGFMAYFGTTSSPPGIIADMLTLALNSNGMMWKTSPAVTELEQVTLEWLRRWMGLPEGLFGMTHDTASSSSMHAIAAARELADPEVRRHGGSQDLRMYTSAQAHSSIEKGALSIGIGQDNVRKIAVDDDFRMRPDLLRAAIEGDIAAGFKPFCVVATVGTTSTTSVDPVPAIAEIAREFHLWLHVDAAYAGSAAIAEEYRGTLAGCEHADSLVTNPHKWLLTPFECSVFYTRRPEILRRAYSLVPEYLRSTPDPRAVNFMEYGVPLGRKFRALKLWFIMRYYGREAIADLIRAHCAMARELAAWVDADARFVRVAPVPYSTVCFRHLGGDEENRAIIERVNRTGEFFLSETTLLGKVCIRVAIGNMWTSPAHVRRAWELISAA